MDLAVRLARQGSLSLEERQRLEADVIATLLSGWSAASALAGTIHASFPELFQVSAVRAIYHLGLESGALTSEQRRAIVEPLFLSEERFDELLMHAERLALGTRLRLSSLCRHVCEAAGRLPRLLDDGRGAVLDRVLSLLFRDRDPFVAMQAAWALGLRESPIVHEVLSRARATDAPPHLRRRALIAAVSRAFDRDAPAIEGLMNSELVKREPAARALLVRALSLAPATGRALVTGLAAEAKAPEVLQALAEHAIDVGQRARILAELAPRVSDNAPKKLRWLVGPRSGLDEELFQAYVGIRDAAARSAGEAHEVAKRTLSLLGHDHLGCEAILFDGTWLRDALVATDEPATDRRESWVEWVRAIDRARTRAVDRVASEKGGALRDALGQATRALDASLRGSGRGNEGTTGDALRTAVANDADRLLRALGAHLLGEPEGALTRPLAYAWATAAEVAALAHVDSFDRTVATATCTDLALVRHAAQATTVPALSNALAALIGLRTAIDEAEKGTGGASAIVSALLDALRAVSPLAGPTSPTRRALEALVVAVDAQVMFARGQLPDVTVPWARALEEAAGLRRALHEVLGVAAPELPADKRRTGAIAALFKREKTDKPMPADNAKKAVAATLPPLFDHLYEALALATARETRDPKPTSPGLDLAAGENIGDFVVDRTLGKGGMGSCLLVRRRVAAKDPKAPRFVLKLPLRRDQVTLDLFIDEATTLLQLAKAPHPGVVEFISCATKSYRVPFLVMAWVEGQSLDERIRKGAMKPAEVAALGAALADALAHCHRHEITHHDVKPANVILARDGRPVLVDFGISSAARRTGAGSLQYMAPERFGGPLKGADWPSDVFALGCVLFEALASRGLLDPPLLGAERTAMADVATIADGIMSGAPLSTQQFAIYYAFIAHRTDVLAERIRHVVGTGDPNRRLLADLLVQMVARDPTARPRAGHAAVVLRSLAGSGL